MTNEEWGYWKRVIITVNIDKHKEKDMRKGYIRAALAAMVIIAVLSLSACASLSAVFKEPAVTLASVSLEKINFTGTDLLCKVNI